MHKDIVIPNRVCSLGLGMGLGLGGKQTSAAGGGGENFLDSQTLIFDASGLAVGAFPATVANTGSAGGNIVQNTSRIAISATGSPNGIKFAINDGVIDGTYDALRLSSGSADDVFDAGAGSLGIIGYVSDGDRLAVINPNDPYLNIGDVSDGGSEISLRIYDTGYKEANHAYTGDTWAAFFARWNGSNIYWRVATPAAAGAWQSGAAGNIGDMTGAFTFCGNQLFSAVCGVNRCDTWATDVGETDADTWIATALARISV